MQKYSINTIIKTIQNKVILFTFIIGVVTINPLLAQNINKDSLDVNINNVVKKKSPSTAMICSLVFPGLGQAYNGKKIKTLVFFCAEFGLIINANYQNRLYIRMVF